MSVKALHLRRGQGVQWEGQVWVVFSTTHVVKGKGQSYMQIELKNAKTGQLIGRRFRVDEQLDEAFFERKKMEYLYSDGSNLVVMDPETYDQVEVPKELVGDKGVYLTPNMELDISFAEGQAASIELDRGLRINVVSPGVITEAMESYGPYFRGFESVPAARAALAYAKSVEGKRTGQVFQVL